MPKLTINAIVNSINDRMLVQQFDDVLRSYKNYINSLPANEDELEALQQIYIQFQFDADWDNAMRGLKIGRYSPKNKQIVAYIEITRAEFGRKSLRERYQMMGEYLLKAINGIDEKMRSKAPNTMPTTIKAVEKANQSFLSMHES